VARVLLVVIVVPVFLILMLALLLPLLLDEKDLLNMAAKVVKEETGATLAVNGEANLSIFPRISVDLSDTAITLPGKDEASVSARFLGIGLELMPLFSGRVEIGEVAVDGLVMTVHSAPEEPALDTSGLTDEQLDVFYAERRKAIEGEGQSVSEESVAAAPLALNVKRLLVTDSVVESISVESGERTRVEIINLEATDLNFSDSPMPVTMKVRLESGDGAAPIDVSVAAQLRIDSVAQLLSIDEIALEVQGVLAEPITVQAHGQVDLARQATDLQLELIMGDTRGEGKLRFASFESPQIDTSLHLNVVDPALLLLAGPEAGEVAEANRPEEAPGPGGQAADTGDQPLPLDAIRSIETRALLTIDRANLSGHAVENLDVKLRAVDGVIRINNFTGDVHGGKLDMKAVFNGQHNTAKLRTTGGVKGLDISAALKAMESEPIASGTANLQWNLSSTGSTSNELVEAMKGPIELATNAVTLESLGVEKMLCEAVALANGKSMTKTLPDSTKFQTLSAKLNMKEGKVRMAPFRAELPGIKLRGEGALDLLKQDFSATITARLSDKLGRLDPACRVNERITAVGWPVNCKGNLAGDPADWCAVDSEKIIKDMATKELQSTVEKEAGKLFDKLFN
jgi:AsmA protein